MKRTIEINDTLQDRVDQCIEDTKELLLDWLREADKLYLQTHVDPATETPCLHNHLDHDGRFSEIIDSNTPIYYSEIDTIFYLHGQLCEDAFENCYGPEAKTQDGWPCGWKAAAIYQYLHEQACEWYNDNAYLIMEERRERNSAIFK